MRYEAAAVPPLYPGMKPALNHCAGRQACSCLMHEKVLGVKRTGSQETLLKPRKTTRQGNGIKIT